MKLTTHQFNDNTNNCMANKEMPGYLNGFLDGQNYWGYSGLEVDKKQYAEQ